MMRSWLDRARRHATGFRMTLGTRLLLVLVSIVAASTVITVALQERALRDDLERAAHARLERTSTLVGHLVDTHLAAQRDRLGAIASTPQFLANLESGHAATLSHFAAELAERHDIATISFVSTIGDEVAGQGDDALRAAARQRALREARRGTSGPAEADASVATLIDHDGRLYAVSSVPIHEATITVGRLVAATPIAAAQLAAWSKLVRAKVSIGPVTADDRLSAGVRPAGSLQVRVSTTFETEHRALANSRRWLLFGGLLGLALGSAASIVLARSLVRPIRGIQDATRRIGEGDVRFRLDEDRRDEVGDVARAINGMLDGLDRNIRERMRAEKRLSHTERHDALTGLANRRLLAERLTTALRDDGPIAVLACGLDRFKTINDSLGTSAGDTVLIETARRLRRCVASAGDRVTLGRAGDASFVVVAPEAATQGDATALAGAILDAIAEPFDVDGEEVAMRASIGIVRAPDDADDAETLLRYADMAMARAREQGGNAHASYADSMQECATTRLALESGIRDALENDAFDVLYQPKLDLHSRRVTGVEALIRWSDPERGAISPAQFIPIAEENGAIVPIGEWVLRKAIEQALEWQRDGLPRLRVGVNVSACQIDADGDFVDRVRGLLDETGLEPGLLDLEITEGALLADEQAAIDVFGRLRALGVGVSLDDFGTGYSSLSYLQRLPIDTLKIDRSFLHDADTCGDGEVLIGSIIEMAKVLELRVVVEGVETMRQRRFLERAGCDEIQGFLISGPVDAKQAATIVRRRKPRAKRPRARA